MSCSSLAVFKIVFVIIFWQLDCDAPGCGSLNLFSLEFVEILGCVDACFSPDVESWGHYFFKCSFCPFSSSTPWLACRYAWCYPTGLYGSLSSSPFFFSVFLRLEKLDWPVSSLCLFCPASLGYWALLVNFPFQLFYFWTPKLIVGSFYNLYLFIGILHLMGKYSQTFL